MKKTYKRLNNGGSMTVEASVIFPIIILAIAATIYICVLLYHHAYIKAVSNHVAQRGAACWSNISKMKIDSKGFRLETGELKTSEELLKEDLYLSNKEEKIKIMKTYALYKLKKNNILESEISKLDISSYENINDKVDILIKDYIVYKELNVIIKNSYKIPFGESLKVFGLDDKYNIEVHSRSIIKNPAELIRNIDFTGDTLEEYEVTSDFIEKFKNTISIVKENIERFFSE